MSGRPRQPNFPAFLWTGGILGLLAGALVSVFGSASTEYGLGPEVGYMGVLFGALGLLLGGVLAVLLDRRR